MKVGVVLVILFLFAWSHIRKCHILWFLSSHRLDSVIPHSALPILCCTLIFFDHTSANTVRSACSVSSMLYRFPAHIRIPTPCELVASGHISSIVMTLTDTQDINQRVQENCYYLIQKRNLFPYLLYTLQVHFYNKSKIIFC